MQTTHENIQVLAKEMNIKTTQIEAVKKLLQEDATIPFIARYRKEATGSLDEVQITLIRDRLAQFEELNKRRNAILKSLSERELLTKELQAKIEAAATLSKLEDLYLPFKPKRRTRAMIAREKGLAPLAEIIAKQESHLNLKQAATPFLNRDKGLSSLEEVLSGARDIIAENINEDLATREQLRTIFSTKGELYSKVAKGKKDAGAKFRDYFDWREPVAKAPGHRVLAMFRGEKEALLKISLRPPSEDAIALITRRFVKGRSPAAQEVQLAVEDAYKRLLAPSLENELRDNIKKRSDKEAVSVFSQNLRELLMAPPLGEKAVLGIDPGFRTGCKVVVLNPQGKLMEDTVIYPTNSKKQQADAAETILALCKKYPIEAIAIGNGTAGRETETFIRALDLPKKISVMLVNESGASVYSASEVAREEFPDKDLTVRGAVLIGRRLMDPLSELVKIDPKAIGVGQYQHDVDQVILKSNLDETVVSCVNAVGVEVNTASKQLLTYVSGLGPKLAENIVKYREENGPFQTRETIKKVPKLGKKTFEQSAGFLRIRDSQNPLDTSAVHPERYKLVSSMARDLDCHIDMLLTDNHLREQIDLNKYLTDNVGLPTLNDIVTELAKPGRDPREEFEHFAFDEHVHAIEDLQVEMLLPGIVTNVTKFGAFVDIGVHQDGLVHISQLADKFVKDPNEIVKVQQKVLVKVLEVDISRKRIALTMRN